ncbi:YopX family protein [Liquorilactobacillus satsumensis]|uniref:YopX family protein n=1 Tax=Liquorilactobacillus satsumensis TaxID=259059 RepID=UPI001E5EC049|nr:YopX family protein [Liquorilactobacillus satsumensis]MCC7667453.1 hypothetical protein [Liquorilactobacillus satsumensis]
MSREIKFRAWDKQTKHYWYLNIVNMVFQYSRTGNNEHILRISAVEVFNNSDRFIFEQYTDLKDKNGKEIYEGDILRATSRYTDVKTEVTYVVSCLAGMELSASVWDKEVYDYEVVGNIHETPELLEASHD